MCLNYYCTCDHTTNKISGTHIRFVNIHRDLDLVYLRLGYVLGDSSLIIGYKMSLHIYEVLVQHKETENE